MTERERLTSIIKGILEKESFYSEYLNSKVVEDDEFEFVATQIADQYLKEGEKTRDWEEDFKHENGNYQCKCIYCSEFFVGHKRRVICKICHNNPPR